MKKIYAYTDIRYPGWIKVGETMRHPEERIREQYLTSIPCPPLPYKIELSTEAIKTDGDVFSDHDVHRMLCAMGIKRGYGEWFLANVNDVLKAISFIRNNKQPEEIYEEMVNEFNRCKLGTTGNSNAS